MSLKIMNDCCRHRRKEDVHLNEKFVLLRKIYYSRGGGGWWSEEDNLESNFHILQMFLLIVKSHFDTHHSNQCNF